MRRNLKPWFIRSSSLSKEIFHLNESFQKINVEKGTDLYPELKRGKCYILLSGEITLSVSISSEESWTICRIVHHGLFGLSGASTNKIYHITTLYPSSIGICDMEEIKVLLSKNRHTITLRRGLLGKRLNIPSAPLLGLEPVEAVFYIISFVGNQEGGEKIKAIKIHPQEIAALLGMKREIVTLSIAKLEKRGWIDIMRGNIIVKK